LAVTALAFLWPPGTASAVPGGVVVVRSIPAAGSRVGAAPHTVAVEFASAPLTPSVRVFGPDGRRVDLDGTTQVTHGGATVSVTIENAGTGGYLVVWSAAPTGDGDHGSSQQLAGALTFAVGRVPGWTTGPIGGLLAPGGSSGGLAAAVEIAGGVALAALVVLVGVVLARAVRWSPTPGWEDAVVLAAAGLVLSGTAVVLFLHGAFAAGLPAGDALSRSMARSTLHSAWGVGGILALTGVAVMGLLSERVVPAAPQPPPADAAEPRPSRRRNGLAVVAVVTLLCAAAVAEGHAVSGRMPVLWSAIATAHVVAAVVLAALLLLRLGPPQPVALARAATRFTEATPLRLAAVATAMTGLFLAGRETGSVSAVTHTAYGQIVVLKGLLSVGVLLAVFALSDQPRGPRTRSQGFSSWLPESAAALVVVTTLVTGVLVFQTPARDSVPRPSTGSISAQGVDLEFQLTPARIGANDIHIYVLDAAGVPIAAPDASADLQWPAAGTGPLPIALRLAGPGHFLDYGVEVPFAGTWTLDVKVDVPGGGSRTFASAVTVH